MGEPEVIEIFDKGFHALESGHIYLALACFEQAACIERSPLHCSYLAFCLAKVRSQFPEAVALCREAIKKDPATAVHYLHLGRVYVMAGQRKRALMVLRRGLRCPANDEILRELTIIGSRRPPVFSSLHRTHPFNKFFGMILNKLGVK
jgi:hypothetical protein